MFGQAGNSSFGFNASTQSSPFGQPAFSKNIATTSGFGPSAPSVFGNNPNLFSSKPTGTTTGNLFGNTTSTPTFGASTATQSTFGGFGNTNTNMSLFGTQPNANSNLFGTSNATPAFGQANKPATFGFGQTGTSLFGQTQPQTTQQITPFGQTANTANTGLFGPSGFGGANNMSNIPGTVTKFSPVTGTDTMVKNGVTQTISTRHHCITCMKEYESKSLEELRLEDYTAGRKGAAQGQTPAIFSTTAQSSPFGAAVPNSINTNSGFGSMSGFGNTNQPSNTSLFSKPITGFGAPATTSSAFAFTPTTSTNIFNSQSKPFGATAPTPLFTANNATAQPTGSIFGNTNTQNTGFGAGFNSTQPNQSIGLFNQNKSAFNMPSTSTTNFGFGQTATSTTNNLFGSKPITTGFGSAFNGTAAPTFQAGSTGFGAVQNNQSSLFNNTFKPGGQTSGFSFGNTAGNLSTGLGTTGTSLFNSSAKPNLFDNSGTSSAFNSLGTFGPSSTFGTNTGNLGGTSTNLFGSGMSNTMQYNSSSVPVHQQILALVSAPFGDSPLLKNLLPASGKGNQLLKSSDGVPKNLNYSSNKIVAKNNNTKLKPKVITAAPLSKKSLFDGLGEEDPLLEAFQPRPNAKRLVLRSKSNSLNEQSGIESSQCEKFNGDSTGVALQNKDKENEITQVFNEHRLSTSWLKSAIPSRPEFSDEKYTHQGSEFPVTSELPSSVKDLENTVEELRSSSVPDNQNSSLSVSKNKTVGEFENLTGESNLDLTRKNDSSSDIQEIFRMKQLDEPPNAANVRLSRHGYYTIPSLDSLSEYVKDKSCIVPHFTIGRQGYGNVYFADSLDIYGLDLDEIVHFRHKEVIIYPDDNNKPSIGQGLNRKAQVTLDRVWPTDKSCHEPVTDPKRLIEMDYEGKLRRVSAKNNTRFLEYRPETGSWVFKVDHFSKYGLSDSDDDETNANDDTNGTSNQIFKKAKSSFSQKVPDNFMKQDFAEDIQYVSPYFPSFNNKNAAPYNFRICRSKQDNIPDDSVIFSPTSVNARFMGTESHKLQLMKASFFDFADDNVTANGMDVSKKQLISDSMEVFNPLTESYKHVIENSQSESNIWCKDYQESEKMIQKSYALKKAEHEKNIVAEISSRKVLVMPNIQPIVSVPRIKPKLILSNDYISKNRCRMIADLGISLGRIFKPKWGPQLNLTSLFIHDCSMNDMENMCDQTVIDVITRYGKNIVSANILQRFQVCNTREDKSQDFGLYQTSIEGHLDIQLNNSKIEEHQSCPRVVSMTGESSIDALHAHSIHSQKVAYSSRKNVPILYSCTVWRLCESLWGKLPESQNIANSDGHEILMLRREALSEWLKLVTSDIIELGLTTIIENDEIILALLTANKLEEACERALNAGDHCLALTLSQLSGTFTLQELIKQQLNIWQEANIDEHFSIDRLKLFMLLAGVPFISRGSDTINLCENLDWKQVLAIYTWYLSSPTSSIRDILDLFETSVAYSSNTESDMIEDRQARLINEKSTNDLCYHLLKLYCTGNYPLEAILTPYIYSNDFFDYELSWLLQQTLSALGYTHFSEYVITQTHVNFAAQLETLNLWHWAIFVTLHLQDSNIRRRAVMDLLSRHIELDETKTYKDRENFLKTKLKIPSAWISEAKAIKSYSMKRYEEAAWHFIHAENWNKSHEIIMERIAADAIINEDHDYLKSLLSLLMNTKCYNNISGWTYQGQLLWDYIIIVEELQNLVEKGSSLDIVSELEQLQPQLTSLCTKLNAFPCHTTKHRLCQAEMAKKTLELTRSVLVLQPTGENYSQSLLNLVSQLPLPEDYTQQELRPIINYHLNNITLY